MLPGVVFKTDWVESEDAIVLTIYAKGVSKDSVTVHFTETTLNVSIKRVENDHYSNDIILAGRIEPSKCTFSLTPFKLEIKMEKIQRTLWGALELDKVKKQENANRQAATYPSSSRKRIDADKVAREFEKEESESTLDGEQGLQRTFQQIFANADEDQRRAMQKSFSESGGTVLSTNWSDVGKGTVRVEPPQGMEARTYEK